MSEIFLRMGVLAAAGALTWLMVLAGRGYVAGQRARALRADPLPANGAALGRARLLVFTSEDCRQCHTHQAPAVAQVQAARPDVVIEEIDAPSALELAQRYRIMTVPATVVLDADGRACAVNYGFAPASKLLAQLDGARKTPSLPAAAAS